MAAWQVSHGSDRHVVREQVLTQSAADASVTQLDHLLFPLEHAAAAHELRVEIHRGHVVDHDGYAEACALDQWMLEQWKAMEGNGRRRCAEITHLRGCSVDG